MNRWTILLAAAALASASAAEVDSVSLLERVRSQVLESAKTIPRYLCRQTLERAIYAPAKKHSQECGALPPSPPASAAVSANGLPGLSLVSSDRANLDVMLAENVELYSWPGGGKFDTNNPDDLLGGGFAGSGDFSGFILTAFAVTQTTFQYLGPCETGSCVRYSFDVPVTASRYVVKTPLEQVSLGYHGTIDVDPQSARLLAATVIPTDVASGIHTACEIRTRMTYARTDLSAVTFTIPASVDKEYLDHDGWYFSNEARYTGCRQYSAESSLKFGDDPPDSTPANARPAVARPRTGTTLELRFATSVDSDASRAGDPVEARLVHSVKAMDRRTIPAGAVVRGHLAQVEKIYSPKRAVRLAVRFDTLLLDGAALPVSLVPEGQRDLRGRAVFIFPRDKVTLDNTFVSRWIVR